jgi:hypothetical protein
MLTDRTAASYRPSRKGRCAFYGHLPFLHFLAPNPSHPKPSIGKHFRHGAGGRCGGDRAGRRAGGGGAAGRGGGGAASSGTRLWGLALIGSTVDHRLAG